jgi:hypothetical protein
MRVRGGHNIKVRNSDVRYLKKALKLLFRVFQLFLEIIRAEVLCYWLDASANQSSDGGVLKKYRNTLI